ncbi:MAG: hypothetical protein A2351_07325 [Omnitrophica bacterium RIFOXYB12_FULL_50_7]|nr:MAG: hypothetical protein A2351_07325 [Omnitrophica bacterium RIFOXYB12_FULL_50_7]
MNRGWERDEIFRDKNDYLAFLELLGKCFALFELEVHAYSLMPNHYHLLIHTPRGNLSRAIRHLNGVYTQKFNRWYKTDGPVFRGRYKAILIHDDSYVLETVRYIHRNPWKAGMEKAIGTHDWTSHRAYRGKGESPDWLRKNFVLKFFGQHEKEARARLDAFVREEPPQEFLERLSGDNWPAVLGPDSFKEWVKEKFLGKRLDAKGVPELRRTLKETKIIRLKTIAEQKWGRKEEDFRKVRRGRDDPRKRAMIYASRQYLKATNKEIGEEFGGISHAAISMQYRRAEEEITRKTGCWRFVQELEKALNLQLSARGRPPKDESVLRLRSAFFRAESLDPFVRSSLLNG